MKIEINTEDVISNALAAALAPERLQAVVEAEIVKTVDGVLRESFHSYGPFGDAVKKAVGAMIPHELSIDGTAKWNHAIAQVLSARVAALHNERIAQVIDPVIKEILSPPPASITLSDLVLKAVELWHGSGYETKGSERPTIIVNKSSGLTDGYHNIYLDPESDKGQHLCDIKIGVTDGGKVYSLRINGEDVRQQVFAGPHFNFAAYLFHLYTGGTRLVVDRTDFDDVCYQGTDAD